ncbi:geko [Calliopsis andreniformis]|uniref:geko n=1 Tax=Calliopsis andreniformis TaxID=337506 RepID=UPI003FCCD72C
MVMDTSTVRLVIFVGMFLVFAGDHTYLISSIFGKPADRNLTEALKGPEGPPRETSEDRISLMTMKKNEERESAISRRARLMATIKNACLPKLICELTSSVHQDQLSEMERSLLNLIRDTSLGTIAEVPSRYHFAAHMGQLIAGVEGQGCHNFYPTCPLPGSSVLNMMKKIRLR